MRGVATLAILFLSAFLVRPEVLAQESAREFRPGTLRALQDLPASRLKLRIERLPAPARERAVAWLADLHFTTQDLATLQVDPVGGIYFADPAPPLAAQAELEAPVSSAALPVSPFPASLVFHSKPGAPNVLYLNFTGETVTNTDWNTVADRAVIPAVAFSTDSDLTTFSDAEQSAIRRIWQRVAEDYAPFNVDVTTERPGAFTARTAQAVITRHTDANGAENPASSSGGVAYVGVFGSSTFARYRPAWIYHDNLGGEESYTAEAVAHELGHNLGLSHDGKTGVNEYYGGHGSGETSWGPIMGASYTRNISQWSKGEYYNASNTQDDLALIAGKLSYRPDDHGNTPGAATRLTISANGAITSTTPDTDPRNTNPVNKGVLERNTDTDTFSFVTGGGAISLSAASWITPNGRTYGGNLDILLQLYNSAGQLLLTNNPSPGTAATIQTNLAEGIYYLAIKGTGVGNPTNSTPSGYTGYGTIGQYFISGSVVPSDIVIPPAAEAAITDITSPGVGAKQFSVTYTDDIAINVASIGNDDIHVTGPNGYDRTATLIAIDSQSNGSPRTATYQIDPPNSTWSTQDEGAYFVILAANAVHDTQGEAVPASTLGTFNVSIPRTLYSTSMNASPGWATQGLWQYGAPNYSASGPSSGFTGENILAYNLSGDYENRLSPVYVTTGPINCSGVTSITLQFQRWLRVRNGDTASIQVSTNGTNWTEVWSTTSGVLDNSWAAVQYDLPSWVAGSASVRLRWGMASGQTQNDIGWNLDDVVLLGNGRVDTAVPTVALISPLNGQTFRPSDVITLAASAADDTAVSRVEFFADGTLVAVSSGAPYVTTITLALGTHVISAKAIDRTGASDTSSAIINIEETTSTQAEVIAISRHEGSTVITLTTTSSAPHILEGSSDLQKWVAVATNSPASGGVIFNHTTSASSQVYRIRISSP
jgi:hypothetical protein